MTPHLIFEIEREPEVDLETNQWTGKINIWVRVTKVEEEGKRTHCNPAPFETMEEADRFIAGIINQPT